MTEYSFEDLNDKNLNYLQEAQIYIGLMRQNNLTQAELANKIYKTQTTIANKIRLLKLPLQVRNILIANNVTEHRARALLRLNDEQLQLKVLDAIIRKKLSMTKTDSLIESVRLREFKQDFIKAIKSAIETAKESGVNIKTQQNSTEKYKEIIIRVGR